MIEVIVQVAMGAVLIFGTIAIGLSLLRMHRDQNMPSLMDIVSSTDKKGRVRLDARKCFEAGAFLTSTWVIIFITAAQKFSFEAFSAYLAAWVASRWLRDREQRLGSVVPAVAPKAVKA